MFAPATGEASEAGVSFSWVTSRRCEPVLVQVHRKRVAARAAKHLAHRERDAAQRRIDAAMGERIIDATMERGDDAGLAPYVSKRAGIAGGGRPVSPPPPARMANERPPLHAPP